MGQENEAREILVAEKELIQAASDATGCADSDQSKKASVRLDGIRRDHLRLADQAQRAANSHDALEHYRAARSSWILWS